MGIRVAAWRSFHHLHILRNLYSACLSCSVRNGYLFLISFSSVINFVDLIQLKSDLLMQLSSDFLMAKLCVSLPIAE